jgi:phosphopantetheinyl transferase (holo-ACP synthase)
VFTPLERADLAHRRDPLPGFAARLAAKRAFAVAAGWTDALCLVEIVSDDRGRPSIELRSDASARHDLVVRVSLSHDDGMGVAAVIVERPD